MFDVEEMINFNSFKWKCNMQIFNQTVLNMKVPHIAYSIHHYADDYIRTTSSTI